MADPELTVVVLTWNEERHIEAALDALAGQTSLAFEVVVVDAASTDGTAALVRQRIDAFPVPLRLDVARERTTVGTARNRGVALARAPLLAFLSADAVPTLDWVERILAAMADHEVVYGRQVHAPHSWTSAACVRGLRYHFPDGAAPSALTFASDVNAAYHIELLRARPFDASAAASAVDDLLIARRLADAGHAPAYDPRVVVHHTDVDTARAEWRKNWREGVGWGAHRSELGVHTAALAWGVLLAATLAAALAFPSPATLAAPLGAAYLPAARRAWRRRKDMRPFDVLRGVLAAPLYDLAFLSGYAKGTWLDATRIADAHPEQESSS